jgi:ferrous iron transport protein A
MDILTAQAAARLADAATPTKAALEGRQKSLADLPRGARGVVHSVGGATLAEDTDLVRRLVEIGFIAGEEIQVVAHGMPGREPVAVRLGGTTFALRRFEAEYVRLR